MNRLVCAEIEIRRGGAEPHLVLHFEHGDPTELPLPECQYPVIVTEHRTHVVWVDAADQQDAIRWLDNDLGDGVINRNTLAEFDWEVESPTGDHDDMDWCTITGASNGFGDYRGLLCDAHVRTHRQELWDQARAADVLACAAEGHVRDRELFATGLWCFICRINLPRTGEVDNLGRSAEVEHAEAASGVNDRANDRPQSTIVRPGGVSDHA